MCLKSFAATHQVANTNEREKKKGCSLLWQLGVGLLKSRFILEAGLPSFLQYSSFRPSWPAFLILQKEVAQCLHLTLQSYLIIYYDSTRLQLKAARSPNPCSTEKHVDNGGLTREWWASATGGFQFNMLIYLIYFTVLSVRIGVHLESNLAYPPRNIDWEI